MKKTFRSQSITTPKPDKPLAGCTIIHEPPSLNRLVFKKNPTMSGARKGPANCFFYVASGDMNEPPRPRR
jgi:hypothetical protein